MLVRATAIRTKAMRCKPKRIAWPVSHCVRQTLQSGGRMPVAAALKKAALAGATRQKKTTGKANNRQPAATRVSRKAER